MNSKKFTEDNTERTWATRYNLQVKSLHEMRKLVNELTTRLENMGIKQRTGLNRVAWSASETSFILKVVIGGAFYPNYFLRPAVTQENGRMLYKELGGRDPINTVYFSGFKEKYVGPLYTQAIREYFKDFKTPQRDILVTFDRSSEKIFVTFQQNRSLLSDDYLEGVPGQVCVDVYKALKMRYNQQKFTLNVME